jgi:DNA-binding transcriptional MocR family regulator
MTEKTITQTDIPSTTIDLGVGNPDLSLLPLEMIHRSAKTYFSTADPRSLQYGAEQGDGYLRHSLANFLTTGYGTTVEPGHLFVNAGASSVLDLICTLYSRPGDTIFVEEPSYFLALRIFEDHGLQVISIPMDMDGLRLDALEEKLIATCPKFVYIIPTFQNPSGRTLSLKRREKLVELAQKYKFLVVADEVYHFLSYNQVPPKPFATFSHESDQVISVNSFSKILAPGLRLGWIQANGAVISRLAGSGLLDSGGGMNPFVSAVVRGLVESGELRVNVISLQQEYSQRLDDLDSALRQYLPEAEYRRPQGGFFFWVRIPGLNTTDLRKRAPQYNVDIRQGELFSSNNEMKEFMRLGFCYYASDAIAEGVNRLADCIHQ